MKKIILDEKTLCDLECLIDGYFKPLNTFMNQKEWKNVCKNLHLLNGDFFPLPINLVSNTKFELNDVVHLVDETNYILATLIIKDIYKPDIEWECIHAYGTSDTNHPYVKYKQLHKEKYYISGPLTKINTFRHYDFMEQRKTPNEVKKYFKNNKWDTVVGFQTRNPMHKAHYELTKYALNKTNDINAKLFLNPVVGETQVVDIDYHVRVHCYKKILSKYDNNVLLGLLPLAMRMAGPKEACLHALIRRNYGCSHFVVGRDHAGPSFKKKNGDNFYGPYEAQDLLFKYANEINIKPIVSKMIVYNETKNIYQPIDNISEGDKILKLSGTEIRNKLKNGEKIPNWFSFPDVVSILQRSVKERGTCYYFVGLSGAGKTTYANMLKTKLLEKYPFKEITVLDGDLVRQNLSKGLGFSKNDRSINVRRIGYVASEIIKHGGTVICANIAPYDEDRLANRKLIEKYDGVYKEIWVNTSLDTCINRDVKGLYKLAIAGQIKNFTGISDPFEHPTKADFIITNENYDIEKLYK